MKKLLAFCGAVLAALSVFGQVGVSVDNGTGQIVAPPSAVTNFGPVKLSNVTPPSEGGAGMIVSNGATGLVLVPSPTGGGGGGGNNNYFSTGVGIQNQVTTVSTNTTNMFSTAPQSTNLRQVTPFGLTNLFIGDSLTIGNWGASWGSFVQSATGIPSLIEGFSGQNSTYIAGQYFANPSWWGLPLVICVGRNDGVSDPIVCISNITVIVSNNLINYHQTNWIVLGTLNATNEGPGTVSYTNIVLNLNPAMSTAFSNHYVDIRASLRNAANTNNAPDLFTYTNDCPAAHFHWDTSVHINPLGNEFVASIILQSAFLFPTNLPASIGKVLGSVNDILAVPPPIGFGSPNLVEANPIYIGNATNGILSISGDLGSLQFSGTISSLIGLPTILDLGRGNIPWGNLFLDGAIADYTASGNFRFYVASDGSVGLTNGNSFFSLNTNALGESGLPWGTFNTVGPVLIKTTAGAAKFYIAADGGLGLTNNTSMFSFPPISLGELSLPWSSIFIRNTLYFTNGSSELSMGLSGDSTALQFSDVLGVGSIISFPSMDIGKLSIPWGVAYMKGIYLTNGTSEFFFGFSGDSSAIQLTPVVGALDFIPGADATVGFGRSSLRWGTNYSVLFAGGGNRLTNLSTNLNIVVVNNQGSIGNSSFAQLTNTINGILFLVMSNYENTNLSALASAAGVLTNNGSGVLSWVPVGGGGGGGGTVTSFVADSAGVIASVATSTTTPTPTFAQNVQDWKNHATNDYVGTNKPVQYTTKPTLTNIDALANSAGVLTNNGSGTLSWVAVGGSGVSGIATQNGAGTNTALFTPTLTNPVTVWQPASMAAVISNVVPALWLDASTTNQPIGTHITNWVGRYGGATNQNLSGQTSPVYGYSFPNGSYGMGFYGTNFYYTTNTYGTQCDTNFLVFMVSAKPTMMGLDVMLDAGGSTMYIGNSYSDYIWNYANLSPNPLARIGFPNATGTFNAQGTASYSTVSYGVDVFSYNGGEVKIGTGPFYTEQGASGTLILGGVPLCIGSYTSGLFQFTGGIAELIVLTNNATITDSIRNQIASYLSYKWGISTNTGTIILCDGDSRTYGYLPGPTNDYPSQQLTYLYGNVSMENISVIGETLHTMLGNVTNSVLPRVGPGQDTIVNLWGGDNDFNSASNSPGVFADLVTYASSVHRAGGKIVVATEIPYNSSTTGFNNARLAYNSMIRANASLFDGVCDLASQVEFSAYTNPAYNGDGIHLTTTGYRLVANYFTVADRKVFSRKGPY